jgi:hypothetical protein
MLTIEYNEWLIVNQGWIIFWVADYLGGIVYVKLLFINEKPPNEGRYALQLNVYFETRDFLCLDFLDVYKQWGIGTCVW